MTKNLLRVALIIFVALIGFGRANAQCANDNVLVAGNLTPPAVLQTTTLSYNTNQYVLAWVDAGSNYTINTCSSSAFDTQLTVYEDATGNFVAYNDDFCGLQSSVTFTPAFCGYVRVLLDRYFCQTSANDVGVVAMTLNSAGSGSPTLTAAPDVAACFGQPANIGIANNGTGGLPPYTYGWLPPTNLTTTTTSNTTVTTVTTTATYTLTLTDGNGCRAMDTVVVSVLAAPPVTLGNDTTFCGTGITLDAGNPGSSYLWNTGAGTQTLQVTQSGNYSVSVQFPSGCINQDNINVTITAPPSYSLGPDTSSCGNMVAVDAGSGYVSYTWSTGGTSQMENVSSNDTISVTVVDANGCTLTDTIGVVLNPAPVVNLGADFAQCGGPAILDAGNPGSLFFWSNSTSSQTTAVNATGTYFVNVLTQAGCAGADTINVTINNQPVVNLGPDTSICLANVILDAGNPGSTYAWSNAQTSQVVTVGSGTYNVLVTDPSGCSDRDTISVTTNVPPVVTASADTSICPGGTATLTATGALTYLWSNNAAVTPTTVSPTNNTAYYVTGTDANGCQASDVVIVTLLGTANAQFASSVTGATANFTNQSTGAFTYNWNFGDASPADNSASPSHIYTANGTYTVTLTVTGPCGTDTYTQTVTITQVGIQDNDLANTLSIFPNPNDGQFTVSFEFAEAKDVTVQLTDVSGRVITTVERNNVLTFTEQLGNESLANGVYFVNITTVDGVVTRKIVVQK
jgi:PKD repeat protein